MTCFSANAALRVALSFWVGGVAFASARLSTADERRADTEQAARLIVSATNAVRKREGRRALDSEPRLTQAAREFARFLAGSEKYGHHADGRQPQERARQHGYDYCIVLENIARQFRSQDFAAAGLAQAFVAGWERSPGHRKNMLNPDVTHIGVAIARNDRSGHYYAVQMFGRPRSDKLSFSVANGTKKDVSYRLGDRLFALAPRETRTHTHCVATELQAGSTTAVPVHGGRYVIDSGGAGNAELRRSD